MWPKVKTFGSVTVKRHSCERCESPPTQPGDINSASSCTSLSAGHNLLAVPWLAIRLCGPRFASAGSELSSPSCETKAAARASATDNA